MNARIDAKTNLAEYALMHAGVEGLVVIEGIDGDRPHHREGSEPMRSLHGSGIVDCTPLTQSDEIVDLQVLQAAKCTETARPDPRPQFSVFPFCCMHDEAASVRKRVAGCIARKPAQREIFVEIRKLVGSPCAACPPEEAPERPFFARTASPGNEPVRPRVSISA